MFHLHCFKNDERGTGSHLFPFANGHCDDPSQHRRDDLPVACYCLALLPRFGHRFEAVGAASNKQDTLHPVTDHLGAGATVPTLLPSQKRQVRTAGPLSRQPATECHGEWGSPLAAARVAAS